MRAQATLFAGLLAGTSSSGAAAQLASKPGVATPIVLTSIGSGPTGSPAATPPSDERAAQSGTAAPASKPAPLAGQALGEPPKIGPTSTPAPPAPTPDDGGDEDVIVAGRRPRGSVLGDIRPERTFRAAEIRAIGTDDVEALLAAIGPQTESNRGRGDEGAVTLLNGRRVSSPSEIARIPTEAIERMEIFPEEVALKYGYRADQKVVNVVTVQQYRSSIGQAGFSTSTQGGREVGNADADFLLIRNDTRYGFGATYNRSARLLESDRRIQQASGMAGLGPFRTLLPSTKQLVLNGVAGGHVLGEVSATVNGRAETNRNRSLLGLGESGALRRRSDQDSEHLGTTLSGRSGGWQWTALGNYDRAATRTVTDLDAPSRRRDDARSTDSVASADLVMSGPLVDLPAGPLSASFQGGVRFHDFETRVVNGSTSPRSERNRDQGGLQVNLDLPLLDSVDRGPSKLGRISANANIAIDRLSDAGTMWRFGAGLSWSPIRAIGFIASGTSEQGAPALDQLGGPTLVTPNVRTYDIARREVVDVTQVFGGNPTLRNDERHVVRLGLNARPLSRINLTLSVDYVAAQTDNPVTALPIVSPQVERAFPDRFTRDKDGRLLRVDARPINFAASRQKQFRWGLNLTKPLGPVPPGMADGMIQIPADQIGQMTPGPNGTFTFHPQPGSAFARNIMTASSRLFVSLYHNWYLEDSLLLRKGLPTLDLLNGGATGTDGGRRRHEIELEAGAFQRGLGIRLSATWRSGTEVGGLEGAADQLRFGSLASMDLHLFANLAERFGGSKSPGWLKSTRLTFDVTNLFDARQRVRDDSGTTPLNYQHNYLNPLGRTISARLRHVF
ncbi:TonB-dependent receptor [Sphingomonas aerophila]|uniref:TonB-dependent receptor n=1 Tax=Sphingomonas aerophila TaxID=1344948 RepID=A0A7W9BBD8_9SPHN|nr:TonB-dependent receptor [Sphingomonas aerophila]MBB5714105.1 hypothetical protein [Sphingomonas aerophila]